MDKISKTDIISLTFINLEATESVPVMPEAMTEVEEILDKDYVIETEGHILHSEADPKVIITQEDHAENKAWIEIKITIDSKGLEVYPDHNLKDLELHQGLPVEIKIDVSVAEPVWSFCQRMS